MCLLSYVVVISTLRVKRRQDNYFLLSSLYLGCTQSYLAIRLVSWFCLSSRIFSLHRECVSLHRGSPSHLLIGRRVYT